MRGRRCRKAESSRFTRRTSSWLAHRRGPIASGFPYETTDPEYRWMSFLESSTHTSLPNQPVAAWVWLRHMLSLPSTAAVFPRNRDLGTELYSRLNCPP